MLCKNISYLKDELRPLNSLMFDVSVGKLQIKLIHILCFSGTMYPIMQFWDYLQKIAFFSDLTTNTP